MKYTRLSFGAIPFVLAACSTAEANNVPAEAFVGETITIQAESLTTTIPVDGTVQAARRAEIATRMMARVTSVLVEVGDTVRSGQTILRLGADDIAANRARAEAARQAAQAARDEAARHRARMDTLVLQDAVPEVQRDQAQLMLTQAEAQLQLAMAAEQEVQAAASYATIRAPFSGLVVNKNVDAGEVANPGFPLLVIESTGERDGVIFAPIDAARHLSVGDSLTVMSDDKVTTASIRAVSGGADQRTRSVEIKLSLPADWKTGAMLTALVPAGTRSGITVPADVIVRRGQLTGVRVNTPDGVTIRWIRLGRIANPAAPESAHRYEVLSGLEAGSVVVR